jgi:D-sedoheptulose 7-phosphate isomerase
MSRSNPTSELICQRFLESASLKEEMSHSEEITKTLSQIVEVIIQAYKNGGKVLLFGNGGSAADSQHITAELVGRFCLAREPFPAISLTTNTSSITAISNDFSFDEIFLRQMKGLGQEGDVAIGISTSGNSRNVILALDEAKRRDLTTIAFTGSSGGELQDRVDFCLRVPSSDTARIQEGHITAGHIMCELVEKGLSDGV